MSRLDEQLMLWPGKKLMGSDVVARRLHTAKMRTIVRHSNFKDGLPPGWAADSAVPGKWWTEDGALWGRAEANEPAAIWYKDKLPENHLIAFRGAIMPIDKLPISGADRIGELNLFWNATGDSANAPFLSTVGSFYGWYAGFAGIEYLGAAGTECVALSQPAQPSPQTNYNVMGGRLDETDFFFVSDAVATQSTSHSTISGGRAAIGTFGSPETPALIRIEEIAILEIIEASVELVKST